MSKGHPTLSSDLSWAVHAPVADLTNGAGTPAAGTVDVTATPSQATINANFATLLTRINVLTGVLRDAGIIAS